MADQLPDRRRSPEAERQARLAQRREQAGLKRVHNLWAHPDDEPEIKRYAAELQQAREQKMQKM
jgi:hypothetical protein